VVDIVIVVSPQSCDKCKQSIALAHEMVREFPGQVGVRIFDVLAPEADRYGVVLPPTVVVGDLMLASGQVPKREVLRRLIQEELQVADAASA
jgi:hypothetical protein